MVVVDTKFGESLAQVEDYIDFPKEEAVKILKWVIQKVDMTDQKEIMGKAMTINYFILFGTLTVLFFLTGSLGPLKFSDIFHIFLYNKRKRLFEKINRLFGS